MEILTETVRGRLVVTVFGELDLVSAPAFRARLYQEIDLGARSFVVDLTGVDFIDSTALGALVGALKRARESGGEIALTCPHERLLSVFRITALDRVFALRPTLSEAVDALDPVRSQTMSTTVNP